jgi:hypothetical protein
VILILYHKKMPPEAQMSKAPGGAARPKTTLEKQGSAIFL